MVIILVTELYPAEPGPTAVEASLGGGVSSSLFVGCFVCCDAGSVGATVLLSLVNCASSFTCNILSALLFASLSKALSC